MPTVCVAFWERVSDDVRRVRSELLADDDALVTMALETQNGDDEAERHNAALAHELDVRTAHHVRANIRPSRLRDLGALRPHTTFIHGNGLDADELAVIADSGGSLSIAPVVELALGLGHPMINEARAVSGLPVSLSIDVEVTSATDMFSQMRSVYLAARSTPDGPTPRDVLGYATLAGARALGLDGRTGSITPGKQADLLVLRADRPDVFPVNDPTLRSFCRWIARTSTLFWWPGTVHKRSGRPARDDTELLERARRVTRRLASAGVLEPTERGHTAQSVSDADDAGH